MEVLIIGKEECSSSKTAKEFSELKELKYTYKKVPEDISLNEAYKITGSMFKNFPAILINGSYIGSFKEYENFLNNRYK